ncbi:MAG: phosphoribosyltransferase family protein [Bacteroidales bacterium]
MLSLLEDFVSLIYPQVCQACGNTLFRNEEIICTYCRYHLPRTHYHKLKDNPLAQVFWGRVNLENVSAFYFFRKGGKVQHLMHQFKYRGKDEIGVYLGKLYGAELREEEAFSSIEMVIPVPLHIKKLRKRGYNQSEKFAEGLAASMNIELETSVLIRTFASETQTRKTRFNRWENVKEIFKVTDPQKITGKHILLVDDVITTGATIEASAQHLLETEGVRLSVASLACAVH